MSSATAAAAAAAAAATTSGSAPNSQTRRRKGKSPSSTDSPSSSDATAAPPPPLRLSLPASVSSRPPIAALFAVSFDVKAGYTLSWKRTGVLGLDLSNSVEFKSLPSGLHNVQEDLVYFVHDEGRRDENGHEVKYAGISAFVNNSSASHERGALMLAVGALIPLENGRLGRSWRHADRLKELARGLAKDEKNFAALDAYWDEHGVRSEEGQDNGEEINTAAADTKSDDKGQGAEETEPRRPSLEQAQAKSLMPGPTQELSLFHPARTFPSMLETFGPLIYPLYKAALLRKRILILNDAPVELACNYVYNISILSNIPSALAPLIPLEPLPQRLQPLFSVGVHDIDSLSQKGRPSISLSKHGDSDASVPQDTEGWVACTTDEVLRHKKDLYDVLVILPSKASDKADGKQWPRIQFSDGTELCANQRDVRRWTSLHSNLNRRSTRFGGGKSPFSSAAHRADDEAAVDSSDDDEEQPLLARPASRDYRSSSRGNDADDGDEPILPDVPSEQLEPVAWSALAYSSFIWWASAGEKAAEQQEEAAHDSSLFSAWEPSTSRSYTMGDNASVYSTGRSIYGTSASGFGGGLSAGLMTDGSPSAPEMAVIAYFHRLTTSVMEVLANLIDDSEDEEAWASARRRTQQRGGSGRRQAPRTAAAGGAGASPEDQLDQQPSRKPVVVDAEDVTRMGLDAWSEGDRLFVAHLLDLYWGREADVRGGRIDCCGIRIF